MSDGDHKYWYNSATGEIEFGMISPAIDRIGPFDTEAEARRAPEVVQERALLGRGRGRRAGLGRQG